MTLTGISGANGGNINPGIWTYGAFNGVDFATLTTDSGTITLNGTGNTGGFGHDGILIYYDTIITATGTGNIAITGTGGNGTDGGIFGLGNAGVLISRGTGTTTSVNVNSGTLSITGTGNGTGDYNAGIALLGGAVLGSTDSGDMTLIGNGANAAPGIVSNNDMDPNPTIIRKTGGADSALTLQSNGTINLTNATITSTANKLDTTLWSDADNSGAGAIAATNSTITSNGGNITLGGGLNPAANTAVGDAAHVNGITLDGTTFNAGGGNIALRGTGWSNVGAGDESGIVIENDSSLQTAGGAITLTGTGGVIGAGYSDGIDILASNIQSISGAITLTGVAGANTGVANTGIYTAGNWDGVNFTTITTDSGTITLNGTGGTGSTGMSGVIIDGDSILTATGTGDITILGMAGNGGDGGSFGWGSNTGVLVSQDGGTTTSVTVNSGTLSITGTGNGAGDYNAGIYLPGGGVLDSTGSGAITLAGQGVNNSPDIVANNDWDAALNTIGGGAAGNITLTGNTMDLANFAVQTADDITLKPRTAATTIGLGGAVGTLNLTDAELGFFDAGGLLTIGRADGTGAMTLDAYNGWTGAVRFLTDPTGSIIVNGAQGATAASDATFLFSGPVTLNADLNTSAATGGARDIDFDAAVTLGADVEITAGAGDVTFGDAVDGAHDFEITTTGDVTFAEDVGSVTPLGDVTIDPHDFIAGGSFHAASFTLTGGTGLVDFSAGTGLTATGDIAIATNDDILGTYTGTNGVLDAGAGSITATVSFGTLDISGAAATLLAGYIGAPGAVTQTMANLIAIDGQRYPWPVGIPNDDFTFAGLYIGGSSGGGGSQPGGGVTSGPVSPPVEPTPSVLSPSPPVTENRDFPFFSSIFSLSSVQRSALEMTDMYMKSRTVPEFRRHSYAQLITYSPELWTLLGCGDGDKYCYGDDTP
jgi:hypothetical protein